MKTKLLSMLVLLLVTSSYTNAADHYSPTCLWQQCMFKEMIDLLQVMKS